VSFAALARYLIKPATPFLASFLLVSGSLAQRSKGPDVIIELRLAGDGAAVPQLRECLTSKLSQMPDIEIASPPADSVRFIIDVLAAQGPHNAIFASFVIAQTFPIMEFRPRFKKGEDADALLTAIRYYTLLRLHEVVPGGSAQHVCTKIASEIANKVLSTEYTARDD
jgi:hypothetical protein